MSKSVITNYWLVLLFNVVFWSNYFVSSSPRSNHRQISSIFCLRDFLNVNLRLVPRKNQILASFWELYYSILRKTRLSQRVSMILLVDLYLDSYFSYYRVNSDFSVNRMYILFVTLQSISSGNDMVCSLSVGNVLLFEIRVLSCVMMEVVSSICLIASNSFWCTFDKFSTWFCFSGLISRVHFVLNLLFTIVVVATCSMRRLQIVF